MNCSTYMSQSQSALTDRWFTRSRSVSSGLDINRRTSQITRERLSGREGLRTHWGSVRHGGVQLLTLLLVQAQCYDTFELFFLMLIFVFLQLCTNVFFLNIYIYQCIFCFFVYVLCICSVVLLTFPVKKHYSHWHSHRHRPRHRPSSSADMNLPHSYSNT